MKNVNSFFCGPKIVISLFIHFIKMLHVIISFHVLRGAVEHFILFTRKQNPLCREFHPEADGCIRSTKSTATGAGNHCCYTSAGRLIGPIEAGAGMPDRATSFFKHQELDVNPFNWCCRQCSKPEYCQYYKNLRKGDNSHCRWLPGLLALSSLIRWQLLFSVCDSMTIFHVGPTTSEHRHNYQ
jgi:hypothetical protein